MSGYAGGALLGGRSALAWRCRQFTRFLSLTVVGLWVGQLVFDLCNTSFGVADTSLLVRVAAVLSVVFALFLSSRLVAVANWLLLPLGLTVGAHAPSTTSQGLNLPRNWFDKIAPVGSQNKNPVVVDADPGWHYISKHHQS
jgi:hypothetical protein